MMESLELGREITALRYHDISCGHRVVGHESKCRYLHGHNYRIHFEVRCAAALAGLDDVGRVVDFGVIKATLCEWLELRWDHRLLLWEHDPILEPGRTVPMELADSLVVVPFNPTAENMAQHLLMKVGPEVLPKEVQLVRVTVDETRKCSATATSARVVERYVTP